MRLPVLDSSHRQNTALVQAPMAVELFGSVSIELLVYISFLGTQLDVITMTALQSGSRYSTQT